MRFRNQALDVLLIFVVITAAQLELIKGQSLPGPARITIPVVNGRVGQFAALSCGSLGTPLSLCLWERTQSLGSNLILTFDTKARTGITSGVSGYDYKGEGLEFGDCGFRIDSVKEEDFKKWQCTLISDKKVFRGYVELKNSENDTEIATPVPPPKMVTNSTILSPPEKSKKSSVVAPAKSTPISTTVAPPSKITTSLPEVISPPKTGPNSTLTAQPQGTISLIKSLSPLVPVRQSRQYYPSASSGSVGLPRGRPIVTVETARDSDFSRSSRGEDIPTGLQIQEIQVQSSGLEIKQKKAKTLIYL